MTFRTTRPRLASVLGLLALVATLLGVPAGAASAAAPDAVTLSAAGPVLAYDAVTFQAHVTSGGAPVAGVNVALYRTGPDGTEEFTGAYEATDAAGSVALIDGQPVGHASYVAKTDFVGTSQAVSP